MARRRRQSSLSSYRRPSPWQGSLRLLLVLSGLVGVNLYFFYFRGGTSLRDLMKSSALKAHPSTTAALQPSAAPSAKPKPPEEPEDARVVEGTLKSGDTIERALRDAGLQQRIITDWSTALGAVVDLRTARPGDVYTFRFDAEDHLRVVDYRVSPLLAYHVERGPNGLIGRREEKPLETRVAEIGGTIESSLYETVKRLGESPQLVAWFVDMFAWDLNFYTDTQAGDRFKVVVEKRLLGGKFYKFGRVLAAEYQGKTGSFRAFWFEPKDGSPGGYYTEHGENVTKSFLKTPLKFVRVSSGFDRHRFHPVLHVERAHLGVDYAAPVGTPVWAPAAGTVRFVGRRGESGNCIVLAHEGGLESTYMHLSKFSKGLAVGEEVRQKQVIGYVGATGLATGAHLHFSLKQNNQAVDPRSLKPERAAPVDAAHRAEFVDSVAPRLQALVAIDTERRAALGGGLTPRP